MKSINGDLIKLANDGYFGLIVHGCNCFNEMGKGFAGQIKYNYPAAYEADCKTEAGDQNKLGTCSVAIIDDSLIVINAYTQFKYKGRHNIDYDAVRDVFRTIAEIYPEEKIGIPKIGTGMAGGNWSIIRRIIDEETQGLDITFVNYRKSRKKK